MDPNNPISTLFSQIAAADSDEKLKKDLVEQLNTALGNLTRADLGTHVGQMPLEVLFDCLDSANRDQIETTCGILKTLMVVSEPLGNLQKYHEYMLQGFQHPSGEVRKIIIAQLLRCVESSDEGVKTLCNENQDLLICTTRQLANEDLSVSKVAALFLLKLCSTDSGSAFLLGPAGIETLKQILDAPDAPDKSDAVKFRVYEALAQIANFSEKNFREIEQRHMLVDPLSHLAFESGDPLTQMNALEILAILAESHHGLEALISTGVFAKVKRLSVDWSSNRLSALLFPGIIKFIGKVGAQQVPPEDLVNMVLEAVHASTDDVPLATVGIEALAYIGSTPGGKKHLDQEKSLGLCFEKIRDLLENAAAEYRCRVLEALSYLFGSDEANTACLPRWFGILFPQISVLFHLVQLPFTDIRLKALNFLASIAHFEWAQIHYLRGPGSIEFLLDRNEPDKECTLAKFNIVKIIVDTSTPTTLRILSPETMARLRVHIKEGPFYAPAQSAVAYEGAS